MLLELRNTSGTFQSTMYFILTTVKWRFAFLYLDDKAIPSRSQTEHIALVRKVLMLLNNPGVVLRLKKCLFYTKTIDYL